MTLSNDELNTIAQDLATQDNGIDALIQTVAPSKLDADQYMADDLDGVTESLFGSGNLAHASLQASQTDEAIRGMEASTNGAAFDLGALQSGQSGAGSAFGQFINSNDGDITARSTGVSSPTNGFQSIDRSALADSGTAIQANNAGSGYTATTVGSLSASQLSSDAGNFASALSGLTLGSGLDGAAGSNGSNGTGTPPQNGTNGASGTNGTNGVNGTNGNSGNDGNGGGDHHHHDGDTNIDIDIINLGETLLNIDLGDAGDIINNVLINLNQSVTNITDFLSQVINVLGDIITSIDLTSILDLDFITEIITNITDNLTSIVNIAITQITDIVTNITNIITNLLGGDGFDGLHLTLDLNLLDTLITGIDIPLYDILATDLNLDISLTPALTLVENLGELTGLDLIADALDHLEGTTTALQNTIDGVTDIVTNLDLKDLAGSLEDMQAALANLDDLVVAAVGDVNGLVTGALDTLGLDAAPVEAIIDTVLDPVLSGLGDLLDGNLLDGGLLNGELPDLLGDGLEDALGNTLTTALDLTSGLGLDGLGLGIGEGHPDGLISQTVDPVINDIGNILDDLTGGATAGLTDTLDNTVDQATDFVDALTGGLSGGLLGLNNNNQNGADGDIDVNLGLGIPGQQLIDETLQVALDPVEDLLGDIDIGLDLGLDLFGQNGSNIDNNAGDSDITLHTGIDIVDNSLLAEIVSDIPLDPVEALLGDIDLDLGASINLLGDLANPFVNNGEGGTGEDTLLAQIGDTLEDITSAVLEGDLDLGADVAGNVTGIVESLLGDTPLGGLPDGNPLEVLTATLEDTLDDALNLNETIETILNGGDTDFGLENGLGDALGLLDNIAGGDGLLGNLGGGLPDGGNGDDCSGNWTESLLPEVGGLFDDLTGGLGGAHDVLPDPVGTIAEGLGAIAIIPPINLGKLGGGLFG